MDTIRFGTDGRREYTVEASILDNLSDAGWLLVRFSGTEPLIRVYTETTERDKVGDILQAGLDLAGITPSKG